MSGSLPASSYTGPIERLHEMELEQMAQEAFYNGLRDEYKPMVVHMLENLGVTVGDLIEAVRKVESTQE